MEQQQKKKRRKRNARKGWTRKKRHRKSGTPAQLSTTRNRANLEKKKQREAERAAAAVVEAEVINDHSDDDNNVNESATVNIKSSSLANKVKKVIADHTKSRKPYEMLSSRQQRRRKSETTQVMEAVVESLQAHDHYKEDKPIWIVMPDGKSRPLFRPRADADPEDPNRPVQQQHFDPYGRDTVIKRVTMGQDSKVQVKVSDGQKFLSEMIQWKDLVKLSDDGYQSLLNILRRNSSAETQSISLSRVCKERKQINKELMEAFGAKFIAVPGDRALLPNLPDLDEMPDKIVGVQTSITLWLKEMLTRHPLPDPSPRQDEAIVHDYVPLTICLQADGRLCAKGCNSVLIGMKIIDYGLPNCHQPEYLHTLAIIDGKENYANVKNSIKELRAEMRNLKTNGMTHDGVKYKVRYKFSSDMKMALIAAGMKAAHSKHSCVFDWSSKKHRACWHSGRSCNQHPRFNLEKSVTHVIRTINAGVMPPGHCALPLFADLIDFPDFVTDGLHLLLRIGDVLLRKFMRRVSTADKEDAFKDLLKTKLNMSFEVYASLEQIADQPTIATRFTQFNGRQYRKLFKCFDPTWIFDDDKGRKVKQLWKEFWALYNGCWRGETLLKNTCHETLQKRFDNWLQLFLHRGTINMLNEEVSEGAMYSEKDITPYIHVFVSHTIQLWKRHGNLTLYSCQALEARNAEHQRSWFRQTMRGGGSTRTSPLMAILLAELRRYCKKVIAPKLRCRFCGKGYSYPARLQKHEETFCSYGINS